MLPIADRFDRSAVHGMAEVTSIGGPHFVTW